jgi:hypothetical protein
MLKKAEIDPDITKGMGFSQRELPDIGDQSNE